MNKYKSREIILVMGRTGQGKSIWTRSFMRGKDRVFVFDPLQEFHADYVNEDGLLKANDDGDLQYPHHFRIGVSDMDSADLLGALAFVHGKAWLVIEEGGILFDKGARSPNWLAESVFMGRHRELSILITAQRPISIPIDLRSQASRVICFGQRESSDLNWLNTYFGEQTDDILNLQPLECLDSTSAEITRYRIDTGMDDRQPVEKEAKKPLDTPAFLKKQAD